MKYNEQFNYGSHLPINASALKTFPITGVLELGIGLNSTPLFFQYARHVVSIENNKDWIDTVHQAGVKNTKTQKIIHHELPADSLRELRYDKISQEALDDAIDFYERHITDRLNFMFIDQYAGYRTETLRKLYSLFDVIVCHDTEPRVDHCYGYSTFNVPARDYIYLRDQTIRIHTSIYITKNFRKQLPLFMETFYEEMATYMKKFGVDRKINLVIVNK